MNTKDLYTPSMAEKTLSNISAKTGYEPCQHGYPPVLLKCLHNEGEKAKYQLKDILTRIQTSLGSKQRYLRCRKKIVTCMLKSGIRDVPARQRENKQKAISETQ